MKNDQDVAVNNSKPGASRWKDIVAKYQQPALGRSIWQIINTMVPYLVVWVLMYVCLNGPFWAHWLLIPLVVLEGGLMVRIFIIHHDCGHGSYFASRRSNDVWGYITGVLTFTPYYLWRWEHAIHHANSGDLDGRGTGDVWTLTVDEYLQSSRWRKFCYRVARNPVVMFVIAPGLLFLIRHRFAPANAGDREKRSVHWTNLGVLGMGIVMSLIFGFRAYVLIQVCAIMVAGSVGVWLFYVQHQFEGVYWARRDGWDYEAAALEGSSFYKLPKVLQWFSGNIGFHHIHHLSPRIPNYNLERCHKSEPLFQRVPAVTLFGSLKSFTFRLWDEQRQRLVGYGYLRTLRAQQRQAS
jgi:omega-6 fatty acid desaturase (delta-12 desaturase)